jgi:hypothetical protein
LPDTLRGSLSALDAEQQAFITSGAALSFIPPRQLEHELGVRDAEELRALVSDLMRLASQMAYDADRDMGAAPLNLASRRFNGGTLPTPAPLRDFEREPGARSA